MGATSTSSSPPASVPLPDPVAEARRVVDAAGASGIVVRALGSAAVHLQAPGGVPLLARAVKDIDLAARRGGRTTLIAALTAAGYTPDQMFNAVHGSKRLLFYDEPNERKLDVFIGGFSMCHEIPITDRLEREPFTIPLAELLLTKLQIVQLTERDQRDIYNLTYHHPVVEDAEKGDIGAGIEGMFIARLCARDWGLWRTTRATVERCRANLGDYSLEPAASALIAERLASLWSRVEAEPKSAAWRLRNRVGDRMRWYNEPEETTADN